MIVVDTSAWIDLFRGHHSACADRLRHLLASQAELAVTEMVVAEILSGSRNTAHREALRSRLVSFPVLLLNGLAGFEAAAELYRDARARGVTVRKLADCLIAAPTIAAGARLLHHDSDFDLLAQVSALQIEPV